jgi:RNA-binding protein
MPRRPALTKPQRRDLIRQAHALKPELFVGKDGFSEPFLASLREAFNTKELLKIKLRENTRSTGRGWASGSKRSTTSSW